MDQPSSLHECALELGELRRKLAALEMENHGLRERASAAPRPELPVDQILTGAFAASPTGLAVAGEDGLFLAVNEAYAKLHGYAPGELVGRHFTLVVPPEKRETARTRHHEFFAGREPAPDQWDIVRKDGSRVKAYAETGRLVLPDGRCLKVLSLTDVTRLRRADQRRLFLASIVENSTDMIVGQNLDGTIVSWNRAAEKAFGYKAQEVIGRDSSLLVPPELADEPARIADRLARGEGVDSFDTTRVRKNGERFPVSLTVSPVKNDAGKMVGASAIARDITERKALEEALRQREEMLQELASVDALTGILNRRRFLELATQAVEQAKRYDRPLALIMFDVDHFKNVNDSYGHDFGDVVLKAICRTCRTNLREVDLFGRLGGEEFAVLQPETGIEGALEAAERIRRAQAETPVPHQDESLTVTISLGAAVLGPSTPTLEALLKASDEALYAAKRGGRNRVERA
jgi:diguanylate cyclase (GGDEF)-like protein/PAS domain S-box-containing protein